MMRTLLVTGGAGFIGGNYVLRCLSQDDGLRIVNLDLLTYAGNLDTLRPLAGEDRHILCRETSVTPAWWGADQPLSARCYR